MEAMPAPIRTADYSVGLYCSAVLMLNVLLLIDATDVTCLTHIIKKGHGDLSKLAKKTLFDYL